LADQIGVFFGLFAALQHSQLLFDPLLLLLFGRERLGRLEEPEKLQTGKRAKEGREERERGCRKHEKLT
jgi:hypothetical protein